MPPPVSRPVNSRRSTSKQRRGQHILDVNVRTHQAQRRRKQRVFGAFSIALICVCLGAGLFFGGRTLILRLFLKNPDYDLTAIDVQTDGILSPESIVSAADLRKGTNVFRVDLDGARARLSVIPEVETVEVTRHIPNRVAIDITERKPVAWIAPLHANATSRDEVVNSGRSYLIDANGVLLPPKKPLPQNSRLPIIRGYAGPTTLGQKADGDEIWSALDLLHAYQDSLVGARYQVEEVDLSKRFALVMTDQNGAHTMLGLEDMNSQLKKMAAIFEAAEKRGLKVQTINLLVENNIPVTFQPEPTPEPAPPAAATASPSDVASKPAIAPVMPGVKKEAAPKRAKGAKPGAAKTPTSTLQPFR